MKRRILIGLLVATSVVLTGVATIGLVTEDAWQVTEECTPVSVADSSGSVGSASVSAVATTKSIYANNKLLTLESDSGTWNGRVSSAPIKSGQVDLTAVGPLEFLNSVKTAPPMCNVTAYAGAVGAQGTGNGQFTYPGDVVFDSSGNMFVYDRGNYRIQKFVPDGNGGYAYSAQTAFSTSGSADGQFMTAPGGLNYAVGWLAVDSSGNVYATDAYNNRVQKFTNNLVFSAKVGASGTGNGQFTFATGITIDASNNIWVADLAATSRIQKFNTSLVYQSQFTLGTVVKPRGIAYAPNGDLYITDAQTNWQVKRYTTAGVDTGYATLSGSGTGDGYFGNNPTGNGQNPQDIAIRSTGEVYVSDLYNNRVQVFDATLNYVGQFGSYGSGQGQFIEQRGLAVDANDRLFVSDFANNRVQYFDTYTSTLVSLSSVFQAYIELCNPGLVDLSFVYDCADDPLVQYAGWTDKVWNKLKELSAATYRQIDPGDGVITISDIGARALAIPSHTPVRIAPQNLFAARSLEFVNQNTEAGDGLVMFQADSIYTVDVGKIATVTVTTTNSPTFVNQPTPVDTATAGKNQYIVQDSLGVQVTAAAWTAAGGAVRAGVGAGAGQVVLTFVGPTAAISGFTGPFSFAAGSGTSRTPQLSVTGSGVTQTPEVVTLQTGADESKITSDVGSRTDIPFLTSKAEVYKAGIWATVESVGTVEASFDIPVNPNIPFGQYQGSIVDHNNCRYRITQAKIGAVKVSCTARWHVTVGDVDALFAGWTVAQVDALWSGFETGDLLMQPLRTS